MDSFVNVLTYLMEKYMAENNLPRNREPMQSSLQAFEDLVHPKLDPRRGVAEMSGSVITTKDAGFVNFSLPGPSLSVAVPARER
jgi:hypothetical protein